MDPLVELYPVVILQDRYSGAYSGGAWLAIAEASEIYEGMTRAAYCLSDDVPGPSADDSGTLEFWSDAPPDWIAPGNTPDEALAALLAKRKQL